MNIIYGRVSGDGQTVEQQVSACKRLAEVEGGEWKIVTEKKPGWLVEGRQQYVRVKRLIEMGEVKKVIAWKLDRLGRKAKEILEFFELCEKHECVIQLVTEKVDTSGPLGKMIIYILGTMAELEVENIRLRTREKFKQMREEFDYHGHGSLGGWFSEKAIKKERMVRDLAKANWSSWTIAKETGLDLRTVKKLLATPEGEVVSKKQRVKEWEAQHGRKWYKSVDEQKAEYARRMR